MITPVQYISIGSHRFYTTNTFVYCVDENGDKFAVQNYRNQTSRIYAVETTKQLKYTFVKEYWGLNVFTGLLFKATFKIRKDEGNTISMDID